MPLLCRPSPPIVQTAPFVSCPPMHLALCSAIWNAYACRGLPSPPSAPATTFLHSPPMVESLARSRRTALFFVRRSRSAPHHFGASYFTLIMRPAPPRPAPRRSERRRTCPRRVGQFELAELARYPVPASVDHRHPAIVECST